MANIRAIQPYAKRPAPAGPLKSYLDLEFGNVQRGMVPQNIRTVLTDTRAQATDDTIAADASGGEITVTLPPPDQLLYLRVTIVRINTGNNDVFVSGVLLGTTAVALRSAGDFVTVQSDGDEWLLLTAANDGAYDVTRYGAVGDNVTDDYPAFAAAMAAMPDTGGVLDIPFSGIGDSIYYLSQSIDLTRPIWVRGRFPSSQSLDPYRGTTLRVAAGHHAIIVDAFNTRGGIAIPDNTANTAANNARITGLRLLASGQTTTAHGLFARAPFSARDVRCDGFAGDGFHVEATVANPLIKGNANCWRMEDCESSGNGRHGLFVSGGDVNGGTCVAFNAGVNGGFDIWDESFFGNTYTGMTLSGVGLSTGTIHAQSASQFTGVYVEGTPVFELSNGATIDGGIGASVSTVAQQQTTGSVRLGGLFQGSSPKWINSLGGKTINIGLGIPGALLDALNWGCSTDDGTDTFYILRYNSTYKQWALARGGSEPLSPMDLPGNISGIRASAPRFRNGLFVGGADDMQTGNLFFPATASPTTGTYVRGDRAYNSSPSVGQPKGWTCTVSGSPGTWVSDGNL